MLQGFLKELPDLISDVILDKDSCVVTSNKISIDNVSYTVEDGKFGIQIFGAFLHFVDLYDVDFIDKIKYLHAQYRRKRIHTPFDKC